MEREGRHVALMCLIVSNRRCKLNNDADRLDYAFAKPRVMFWILMIESLGEQYRAAPQNERPVPLK